MPLRRRFGLPRRKARTPHQAHWAEALDVPGLPNFFKVDDNLYRGAQPTREGLERLQQMGIVTVINLRAYHSDRRQIARTQLRYEHLRMRAWQPRKVQLLRFLQIVMDAQATPVFVHCQHGADRTGVMCALYRLVVCGWTKEEAIAEMRKGHFGFHRIWINLVPYIRRLDLVQLERELLLMHLQSSAAHPEPDDPSG